MSNLLKNLIDDFWNRFLFGFIPKTITPNYFTFLRLLLIPFVLYFLATQHFFVALTFFGIAALADSIDGSLARKRKQISDYGTMLDPLADKLLIILSILFLLFYYPYYPILVVVIIIDILILMESVILIVASHKIKVPASNWTGKSKMVFQVIGVLFVFCYVVSNSLIWLQLSLMFLYLGIFTGLISLISYGYQSFKMIKSK
ncbi:CDP-alcohol phosphatidyltransferase family protein [Candidatus Falkowbacteria bacterium]|uniref:CDP-diacylglycerol--glycerol-3-phosphate 3-phosphatidyltransferase n=1 Tax=Candidatus Buchananbacteria bacterium CG10_big_fil_rev_8_21_14_0_10_33_19 TaxID=1974525 RepID=A0A2H0W4R6_9BACT|nr:CDP-alcohol phosphatidyltransferase family protein [Candidatus Falkowbacteria bacterium]PIS06345.1 MAG: hypothetical protein COT80_02140 [Candidatus Buchananbacteria bacterium CG10_big_fil_rev_8_21_14_0_10_33_19]